MVNIKSFSSAAKNSSSKPNFGPKFSKKSPSSEADSSSIAKNLSKYEAPTFSARKNQSLEEEEESNPEEKQNNLFTGSGRPTPLKNINKKPKLSGKNLLKLAPIAIFLIIIIVVAAVSIGAVSLLPGHIDENTQEAFDVQYPAAEAAKIAITEQFLSTGSIPTPLVDRLANVGVETGYLDENNNFIAGLRPTSENSIALASSKESSGEELDTSLVLKFKNKIITSSEFAETITTDSEFFSAFDDATYGRAIGHYDNNATAFYSTIKASRDVFQNYTTTGNEEEDTKTFREILSNIFKAGTQSSSGSAGEKVTDNLDISHLVNVTENKEETVQKINEVYGDAKTFSDNQTASNIAMLLNNAINANETYQSIHYYLAIEESISKTKAGKSSTSPINQVLNFFTESTTSEVADLENDGQFIEVTGSAVQSPGLSSVLTKTYSENLYQETANYSSDRIIKAAEKVLSSGSEVDSSIKTTPLSVTTKSNTIIKDFSYSFINGLNKANSGAVSTLVTLISPAISQSILWNNAGEKLSGIAAGEFFNKGGAALGQHIATFAQSGTIGDEAAITAYNEYSEKIIALEAAADRTKYSPFDINSKNTFLGSIFATINSNLISSSSLFSTFSSFSNLTNNSILSLIPAASAASRENSSYQTTYSSCPALEKIGVKGDIYCNPIITFDIDTIETSLASAEFNDFLDKNLVAVKADSLENSSDSTSLAATDDTSILIPAKESDINKMLEQNNSRLSPFGVKDLNLYNAKIDEEGIIGGIVSTIKSIGSKLAGLFSPEPSDDNPESWCDQNGEALCFSNGSVFRNSTNNPRWEESYKYVQAYVTYDRVLNQMEYFSEDNKNSAALSQYFTPGTGESAVSTYLASFAEEVENESDSEYLARISGMTEEDAENVLAYVFYTSYLASLDYSTYCAPSDPCINTPEKPLLAATKEQKTTSTPIFFEKEPVFIRKKEQSTTT